MSNLLLPQAPVVQKKVEHIQRTIKAVFMIDKSGTGCYYDNCYINIRLNRPDVQDEEKKSSIALYPVYGWGFGDITVRIVPEYEASDDGRKKTVTVEVIDGGHRIRALRDFLKGKFCLSSDAHAVVIDGEPYEVAGKTFRQLDEKVKEVYLSYVMNFETYENLGDFEAGVVFYWKNKASEINDIENLNAIQTDVVAFLRENSREFNDDLPQEYYRHPLFATSTGKHKQIPTGDVIKETDSRMRMMYIMANIFAWYTMYTTADQRIIFDKIPASWNWQRIMNIVDEEAKDWIEDPKYATKRTNEVLDLLDFLQEILQSFNSHSKTVKADFLLLRFVLILNYKLKNKFGKKNVRFDSAAKFGAFLNKVVSELNSDKVTLAYADYKDGTNDDSRVDIPWKLLRSFLKQSDRRAHKVLDIATDGSPTFKRAMEDLEYLDGHGVRILPKAATVSIKKELYVTQQQECAIDGKYCKLEDMEYAHTDIPSAAGLGKGAKTNGKANTLVWKEWNARMGQSTIQEFKNSEEYARFSYLTDERLESYDMA